MIAKEFSNLHIDSCVSDSRNRKQVRASFYVIESRRKSLKINLLNLSDSTQMQQILLLLQLKSFNDVITTDAPVNKGDPINSFTSLDKEEQIYKGLVLPDCLLETIRGFLTVGEMREDIPDKLKKHTGLNKLNAR